MASLAFQTGAGWVHGNSSHASGRCQERPQCPQLRWAASYKKAPDAVVSRELLTRSAVAAVTTRTKLLMLGTMQSPHSTGPPSLPFGVPGSPIPSYFNRTPYTSPSSFYVPGLKSEPMEYRLIIITRVTRRFEKEN